MKVPGSAQTYQGGTSVGAKRLGECMEGWRLRLKGRVSSFEGTMREENRPYQDSHSQETCSPQGHAAGRTPPSRTYAAADTQMADSVNARGTASRNRGIGIASLPDIPRRAKAEHDNTANPRRDFAPTDGDTRRCTRTEQVRMAAETSPFLSTEGARHTNTGRYSCSFPLRLPRRTQRLYADSRVMQLLFSTIFSPALSVSHCHSVPLAPRSVTLSPAKSADDSVTRNTRGTG